MELILSWCHIHHVAETSPQKWLESEYLKYIFTEYDFLFSFFFWRCVSSVGLSAKELAEKSDNTDSMDQKCSWFGPFHGIFGQKEEFERIAALSFMTADLQHR